ncbi:MAG: hypothetical protein ACREU8_10620, partial [Gammaproteobacteria bacterium]
GNRLKQRFGGYPRVGVASLRCSWTFIRGRFFTGNDQNLQFARNRVFIGLTPPKPSVPPATSGSQL